MDTKNRYPTDLTDRQWAQVCRVIPAPKPGGRPAKYDRREIANALLYITRTGCQWRMLPKDLPPWRIVYWYFIQWEKDGTFDRLNHLLPGHPPPPPGATPAGPRAPGGAPPGQPPPAGGFGRPKKGAARLCRR